MEQLPVEMKVEVFIHLTYVDRRTCRRVCSQWRNIIDTAVGLPVKITKSNMSRLFESNMLTRAPVVSIKPCPAISKWDTCPLSPIFLKVIYLTSKISSENWNLLLSHCKALEELIFSIRGNQNFYRREEYHTAKEPIVSGLLPVYHTQLKGIMFRNFIEPDAIRISALLNTLTCPQLKQCILAVGNDMAFTEDRKVHVRNTLISLVNRNPSTNVVIFCTERLEFKDFRFTMQVPDYKQLSVNILGDTLENWKPLAQVHNYEFNHIRGCTNSANLQKVIQDIFENSSERLKHLDLEITDSINGVFNCALLKDFVQLNSLTLRGIRNCVVQNIGMINHSVTILSLYVAVSKENLQDIFRMPDIIRLELMHDFSLLRPIFSIELCNKAINHTTLQIMALNYMNYKEWKKFKILTNCKGSNCSEFQSNDLHKRNNRAIVFNERMNDTAWKYVMAKFSVK